MAAITRNVRDIGAAERRVLEHVLGQKLKENQQLIIGVIEAARPLGQRRRPGGNLQGFHANSNRA